MEQAFVDRDDASVFFPREYAADADGMRVAAMFCRYYDDEVGDMSKRIAAIVLAVTFLSLAFAPETLAQRSRRDGCNRTVSTRSYGSYPSSGVAGRRYYAEPYYNGGSATRYYGDRYYGDRYYGDRYYGDRHSTRDAVLTVAAPAAIGAGVGAIVDGGKGAAVGALLGGGGGALFYVLKHHGRH